MECKHVLAVMCQFVFSVAGILNFHQRREGARQAREEGGQSDENKGREKKTRKRKEEACYWRVDPRLGTKPGSYLSCMHMLSLSPEKKTQPLDNFMKY